MSDASYFRHMLDYTSTPGPLRPLGPWSLLQHIKAITVWQALAYNPALDPPEALTVALRSFNRGIGVRSIYYAWRRIAKWLSNRVHYKRVQRYLVDHGISRFGAIERGLLMYTIEQR